MTAKFICRKLVAMVISYYINIETDVTLCNYSCTGLFAISIEIRKYFMK